MSPALAPDIVVYLDAITIVFEEASKGGPPLSLPIACIESGIDHSLPNLALRLFSQPVLLLCVIVHASLNIILYRKLWNLIVEILK